MSLSPQIKTDKIKLPHCEIRVMPPGAIDEIQEIIDAYNRIVKRIDAQGHNPNTARAYGGIVRAGKGKLHESITRQIVSLAWRELEQSDTRIRIGLYRNPLQQSEQRMSSSILKGYRGSR